MVEEENFEYDEFDHEIIKSTIDEAVKTSLQTVEGNTYEFNNEDKDSCADKVIDECLKKLTDLNKPFKYTVTCIIMQKTGAPLHSAVTSFWDIDTDGAVVVSESGPTFNCLVSTFCVHI
eukprot:Platyproteum_vivax@DN4278_c0_g1_i1.p2